VNNNPPTPHPQGAAGPDETPVSSAILTGPNAISFARILLLPVCAWLLAGEWLVAGIVLTSLVAGTDWLDGWLARRTRQISRLGQLLDPLADRLLIAAVAVALLARGALPWVALALLVGRDLALLVGFQILQRRGVRPPEVIFLGKAATTVLLITLPVLAAAETGVAAAVSLGVAGVTLAGFLRLSGLIALWVGLALYWWVGVIYTRSAVAQLTEARGRQD
jgi:cardiolipin synthase